MKLSKKIISMILVAAMLIAQVSVLPFATESYSSGKGDSASYALKVPEAAEYVEYGRPNGGVGAWIESSKTMGRNDDNTDYASDSKGKIFIAADGAEKFFVLNPASKGATVTFINAPANTYANESPVVFNGIPSAIDSSKLTAMAFRIKGLGTIVDKMVIDLQLTNKIGTDVAYTAKADMLFIDAATGSITNVGYTEKGIELAGNANGWLYVAFTGFKDASDATLDKGISEFAQVSTRFNTGATGYKGVKVTFNTDDFNGKKLYFGNAMFVESLDSFRKVHGTPEAPTLKEATATSITVNAVAGVEYSKDGSTWNANGKFTGLAEGKKYTIYARYAGKTFVSSAALYTKGLADIEVLNTTYDSITVAAVPGLEYCLNKDWDNKNTTGVFTGLEDVTEYTVYAREIGKTAVKTAKVKTGALPWTTGNNESAYYALKVEDGVKELTGALGSFTGSITSLPVVSKDGVNYIALSGGANEGAATINAVGLTYNKANSGLPADMVKYADFVGIAFRMNVAGGNAGTESIFDIVVQDGYTVANGDYAFINAADGTISSVAYENGFKVSGELDGWLIIPFSNIKSAADAALTGVYNQSMYEKIVVTLYGSDKASDWTGRTLNIGTGLFYENETEFLRAYSRPYDHEIAEKTKTSIAIKVADGVEYALDGTDNWTTEGIFENLKADTVYTFKARYIGRTAYSTFTVKTRLPNPTLVAPTKDDVTVSGTTITVNNPLEDHEYSVDGVNWTESGEFTGLIAGAAYNLVVRIYGTVTETAPLLLQTDNGIYSSGAKDAGSFIFRVPTLADAASDANGVYITSTQNNGTSFGIADKLYIEDVSGEKMIKLPGSASSTSATLSSNMLYEGKKYFDGNKGLPEEIVNNGVNAIAFRMAIKGSKAEEYTFLNFSFVFGDTTVTTTNKGQMIFVDAKTGVATNISYRNGIKIYGEVDGWMVIPAETFNTNLTTSMEKQYTGFKVTLSSEWENKSLYIGDTLAVADVTKFLQMRSAPNAPTLLEKNTNSIKVVAIPGLEYCLDGDWANKNTTGVFTGLEENKEYKVYAKYVTNEIASQPLTLSTDKKDPSLAAPKLLSLTDSEVIIELVPGVTYTIDGGATWNELADFGILDPNTEYTIYGVGKVSGVKTEELTFTTPKAKNDWYRGDGSNKYMSVSEMKGEYYQGMYGFSEYLAVNGKGGRDGGQAPLVTIDGEKFIEYKIRTTPTQQSNLQLCATLEYVDDGVETRGFPRGIWMKDQWGFAVRVKINDAGTTQVISPYYQYYDQIGEEKQKGFKGTYYLVDGKAGTWTKKTLSENFTFKGGFDGWILYPLDSFREANNELTWELIQNEWMSLQFFLRAGGGTYGNSNWMDCPLYVGDTVVVEDVNLFMENYAPNTEEKVISGAHNKVTDPNIPGVMANDCTGNQPNEGLDAISNINTSITEITKPNEKSEALALNVSGFGSISVTNDALNHKDVTTELKYQVLDSLGFAFYMNVPKTLTGKIGFNVQTLEQNTEYFNYNNSYYYTVSNGVAMKSYGEIELSPGFNGYVILPYEVFNYDGILSEYVDGVLWSPDTLENFTLEFDADVYPALTSGTIYIDDFYLYLNLEEFATYILKTQGTDTYELIDNVLDISKEDESSFPREMANNCSGIERGEGIYSIDNVTLTLVEATDKTDAHVNVEIGKGSSSVMFENYAWAEDLNDLSDEEYDKFVNSTALSFWISVPEKAPMTVGLDLEILEDESEVFWYNPNLYYYTVEDGKVTQVSGYLEFKPGFEGYVVIPFENFFFDEASSEAYVDGMLNMLHLINYFGFYFETDYYAAIGGTTISVDDFAFCQGTYRFIDAVWAKQTGNSITEVDPAYYSVNVDRFFDVEVADMSAVETGSVSAQSVAPIVTVSGLALLVAMIIAKRKKAEEK